MLGTSTDGYSKQECKYIKDRLDIKHLWGRCELHM